MNVDHMTGYFLTALVLSLAIPILGGVIALVVDVLEGIVAGLLGSRAAEFIFDRLAFPGVVHHELSHALFAFIAGAKITRIELFRPRENSLGRVSLIPRGNIVTKSIQRTFSAIAPVVCGAASSFALLYILRVGNFSKVVRWVVIYLLISIVAHMTMSSKDFKMMWRGYPVVYLLILFITLVFKYNIFA